MLTIMRCVIVPALMVLVSVPSARADAEAGRKMAKQKCQVCHGIDGIAKIPIAPHLAGESQIYLETQLKAFRNGKREHEMMTVVAKSLKDNEITSLAQWYSSIKITATVPE